MNHSLPAKIVQPVHNALEAMHTHPAHLLFPFYRRAAYKGMDAAVGQQAHKMKVILSILAAERVRSYWHIPLFMVEADEEDYEYWLHIPDHLLEMARGIIYETAKPDVLLKEASHLSEVNDLTGQMEGSPYYHEWCVFESALQCAWEALNRGYPSLVNWGDNITPTTTDEELERHADSAMFACLAYTGGLWTPANRDKWEYDKEQKRWITDNRDWYFEDYGLWDRDTKMAIARRQEFWEWWLSQAVEEAWRQVQ